MLENRVMSRLGGRARVGLVAVLLAGTALGGYAAGHSGFAAASDAAPASAIAPSVRVVPDFADLAAQVRPAVVSITVKIRATADADEMPMMPGRGQRGMPGRGPRGGEGRGSGFIVDANGTVVTNNHVVKDASEVSVTMDDGRELPARVIGRDSRTDIAVLKVDAPGKLPFLRLGDSSAVRPGEWVVAMGNPFGLGGSVTAGIVSALGRDIGSGPYDQYIQVDAPINQGNSGGPLFAQDGRVIGINTAIYSPSGGSVGIGFAIPANVVKTVVAQLSANGTVARGFIGLQTQPVAVEMAQALALPSAGGALVAAVEPASPAAKAGFEPGDVVRAVSGRKIATPRDLAVAIAEITPGDTVTLDVVRNGEARGLTVTVGRIPGERRADVPDAVEAGGGQPRIGLALAPLASEGAGGRKSSLVEGGGAMVAAVGAGSPAERAGIQAGDVITNVGAKAVATPEEAMMAIRAAASGKAVALRVMRDGKAMFVAVPLTARPAAEG